MIKAVIFDLDGTIVFSHPTHFTAYERLFKDFGVTWTYEEFNKIFAGIGSPGIITKVLERNGIKDFDAKALAARKRDIFDEILKETKLQVVPGFFDFLEEINKRGLKKIIASGSHKINILNMLKNIGASAEFPLVVSGEEVANPKPAPDIYLEAARRIDVNPLKCLVLEDTEHGVNGAHMAGMKCVAFLSTLPKGMLEEAHADWIFNDYTEIPKDILD